MSGIKYQGHTMQLNIRRNIVASKVGGVAVDFSKNVEFGVDNETDCYRRNCSPTMRMPTMDCGADGYLFESGACFRHIVRLADKNGKALYGKSTIENSQVDQWIDFATNELGTPAGKIFYTKMGFYNESEEAQNGHYESLHWAVSGLDQWLETRTFLVGERLSAADIAVGTAVENVLAELPKSFDFWKYKNVVRFYMTYFYSSPAVAEAQKVWGGEGFPVEKPKEVKAPKKEEPKAAKKEEPKEDAADDGMDFPEEKPKAKNPLDELPPSPFVLDAFKREYSNNKDTRVGVMKYLADNFDPKGWSVWFCKYKYNSELAKVFMTSNLVRGWFQRMEGNRKYAFGIALICGTETEHEIVGCWIIRDTADTLPKSILDVEDICLFDWKKGDLTKDKDLIADYMCWDGKNLDKPCLEGRCFK